MHDELFGTLYNNATRHSLRAATQQELEASRQSVVRGQRGVISVDGTDCYVQAPPAPGMLELAKLTPDMLTSMLDLIPVGVAVAVGGTATTVIGNRRLEKMLGVPAGRNLSLTAADSERPTEYRLLVGGVEVDPADLPFQRAMRTGEPAHDVTVDVLRADGVGLQVTMSAGPLRDELGRIVGGVGVFNEVGDHDAAALPARVSRDFLGAAGGWYRAIADALPEHVWACTDDGASWFWNERAAQYTGRSGAELMGFGWLGSLHPDDRQYVSLAWKIATLSGDGFEAEFRLRRHDGQYRWFHARAMPVARPHDGTIDWFGTSTDVDDRKREALQTSILRAIVREFSVDQDVGELVARVARHCLGAFASFCIFDVYDRDYGLVRLAFAHVDAALEARLHDAVFEAAQHVGRSNDPVGRAIRERRTQIASPAEPDVEPRYEQQSEIAAIQVSGKIVAPVCEPDGELVGVLTFGQTGADAPRLDDRNGSFAEEIARLMSGTFVRARSVARALRDRRTVDKIVRSSLLAELPSTEGVQLDAVYAAGRSRRDVGAAWYDAMWLPDGRLMLSSGNIAGGGVEAALAMAMLRQTLRGAAFAGSEPVAAADVVDKVLRSLYAELFAAVFFGLYDPASRELRYDLRGHPRPMLRPATGLPRQLPGSGSTPLGFGGQDGAGREDELRVHLATDTLLVLYTGSLSATDARAHSAHDGSLLQAIARLDPLRRPAAELLDRLHGGRGCANDIAVMTALFH